MKNTIKITLLLALVVAPATQVLAIDLQPGEGRAPIPGVGMMQLTYQYSERGDRYVHGVRQPGSPEINAGQMLVRVGHSFEAAGKPAYFYAQTPIGYIHPKGSLARVEGDAGAGDTSFLLALWPYADYARHEYFGMGAYLTVPSGRYDPTRAFNMGENRYRWALQTGYTAPLTADLSWMAAVDAVWSSDNNESGVRRDTLAQKVLYSGQVGLRYEINPRYVLGAGYFYTSGGETSLNGVSRDDAARLQRYQLSALANYSFGRITLQYGGDIKTESGYIEDSRWIVRFTKFFF
jgi:hypothetical protein